MLKSTFTSSAAARTSRSARFAKRFAAAGAVLALALGLSACSDDEADSSSGNNGQSGDTSQSAPAVTSAASEEPATAPTAIGPWTAGQSVPVIDITAADIEWPEKMGEFDLQPDAEAESAIYRSASTKHLSIVSVSTTVEPDFHASQLMQDPQDFGQFVCGSGNYGSGFSCIVALSDGAVLQFAGGAGPNNSLEESALFAQEGIKALAG